MDGLRMPPQDLFAKLDTACWRGRALRTVWQDMGLAFTLREPHAAVVRQLGEELRLAHSALNSSLWTAIDPTRIARVANAERRTIRTTALCYWHAAMTRLVGDIKEARSVYGFCIAVVRSCAIADEHKLLAASAAAIRDAMDAKLSVDDMVSLPGTRVG